MKKLFYIFIFFLPFLAIGQQPWYQYSPMDYAWQNVGLGSSKGETAYISLAFSPTDFYPYVAYSDSYYNTKACVIKYDGTNWVNVGNPGFSVGPVGNCSLAFNPSGQPYLAYCDGGNSDKATVMKYDGTNWVNVGTAGFSAEIVDYPSLAFSPSGQPYVAYGAKVTVVKFDGTNWINVGTPGFSTGEYTSLAFSPLDSLPYVAFQDSYNARKISGFFINLSG